MGRKRPELPEIVVGRAEEEVVKLVLVVDPSLGMGKGKVAAQCAHAAIRCYKAASLEEPGLVAAWERSGAAQVVVRKPAGGEGLAAVAGAGRRAGLVVGEVRDAGRTQVEAGSLTVVGLGPGPAGRIDSITAGLKLY
jgi:PTH2 family peptidyl-tRNA hydrolase